MSQVGNVFIDALAGESWIDAGRDAHITYCMSSSYGLGWTGEQKQAFADALQSFAAVCRLTFSIVDDESQADLVEYRVTSSEFRAAFPSSPYGAYRSSWDGYHYGPDDAGPDGPAEGYFDASSINSWLIIHELLHGLGLEHPHHNMHGTGLFPGVRNGVWNDVGTYGLNNTFNTVMSYKFLPGYPAGGFDGPMAMDIAALQALYGANMSVATGNDIYVVARDAYKCIWDAGGIDWLVAGTDAGATIDLRSATLELAPGAGGWLSRASGYTGGYTISHGVEIENARGGRGDDVLIGNDLANVLEGGDGDDVYYTSDANDTIIDTSGMDTVVSDTDADLSSHWSVESLKLTGSARYGTGNTGDNTIRGNGGVNVLDGREGDDWLFGGSGNDYLYGGPGNDFLIGQTGRDVMFGGDGEDVFDFNRINQSTIKSWDVAADFTRGEDIIDLSTIDANTMRGGNQAFSWIGARGFTDKAGQLHIVSRNYAGNDHDKVYIEGDVNGDGRADFRIEVDGPYSLSKGDIIL